jgi:hypothetical protein
LDFWFENKPSGNPFNPGINHLATLSTLAHFLSYKKEFPPVKTPTLVLQNRVPLEHRAEQKFFFLFWDQWETSALIF